MMPSSGAREISTTILGAIRLDGPSATREEIATVGDCRRSYPRGCAMSALPPKADIERHDQHVRFVLSAQSVDATLSLNRSARVSKPKVSRDRSLSCRVTRLNCECAPPAVPQLILLGHRVETSNISSTCRYPLHLLRLR